MLFTVAAPPPSHNSAGIACLHELMRCLKELGHEVRQLDYTAMGEHMLRGILIAPEVFPEIDIPHVRWCLNKPGLLSGPVKYGKGTLVFHYCPELEESAKAAAHDGTSTEFMLGALDIPSWKPDEQPIELYYRGKYNGPIYDHPYRIELTRTYPSTKKKYWELLSLAYNLYSYDDFSAVNVEAHLIGVKVLIWDAAKGFWKDYNPPDYIDRLLFNDERNKAATQEMVDLIKSNM